MRKLIADLIISLDGYFTSPKNDIEWFGGFDKEEWPWSGDILRGADAMLYGRVTYEEFSQFWPTPDAKQSGIDPYLIERLNDLPKFVFSTSLTQTPWRPASLVREDPGAAVARLKKEPGKDIVVVGSGTLVASLLQNNLIDEYFIRIRPMILGAGRPLFVDSRARHPLKLISTKAFKSGAIGLHYESLTSTKDV
ncbi:MAG TPA: dihydrofolate reductase family protein [Nitrososphaerales archaeon]|nr:dihydrofolate reductase family protein [Nitrososphaerales archaeon]